MGGRWVQPGRWLSRVQGCQCLPRAGAAQRGGHAVPPTLLWHSPQMTEMEISRAAAERSLREHMGNVVEALITLTN